MRYVFFKLDGCVVYLLMILGINIFMLFLFMCFRSVGGLRSFVCWFLYLVGINSIGVLVFLRGRLINFVIVLCCDIFFDFKKMFLIDFSLFLIVLVFLYVFFMSLDIDFFGLYI